MRRLLFPFSFVRRSLMLKLIVAFLFVSLIGTVFVAIYAGRTTAIVLDRIFLEQARTNFIADVTDHYQRAGSWQDVSEAIQQKLRQKGPPEDRNSRGQQPPPPPPDALPQFILVDPSGRIVHAGPPYHTGDAVLPAELEQSTPIEVNGQVVGRVLGIGSRSQQVFSEEQFIGLINKAIMYAAIGGTIIALGSGIWLARRLTRPLRELTAATQAMAHGELEQQVPVRTPDELGQLAASFNQMSTDLAHANQLRRQMTADIAHDLRTPLAVITGYTEALRDGILQPNPDMFEVMHSEAKHLQRLIEDLRTLSLADANELALHRQPVDIPALLDKLETTYYRQATQKGITLHVDADSNLPQINLDPERIIQVLSNLVNNAMRYTPKNGQIILSARPQAQTVVLEVQDTGSGIAPNDLPHIFERFYRVDKARQQDSAQSGLGLAIAKAIINAHGGIISAASELGRGTIFTIKLPFSAGGI